MDSRWNDADARKTVEAYVANELPADSEVSLRLIGRKANQYFSRRNASITSCGGAPSLQQYVALRVNEAAQGAGSLNDDADTLSIRLVPGEATVHRGPEHHAPHRGRIYDCTDVCSIAVITHLTPGGVHIR